MKTVGFVAAVLAGTGDERSIVRMARDSTPDGRYLAVLWPASDPGRRTAPTESMVIRTVMGQATARSEDRDSDPWLFASPLAIRHYRADSLSLASTTSGMLFRRGGEPPYRRLRTEPEAAEMSIPSRHPVFTRDVANNVWHMPASRRIDRVIARLASLVSWPDEGIAVVTHRGSSRRDSLRRFGLSLDIVGVAQKQPYYWNDRLAGPGQLGLRVS